jgi:hypothetical protein
MGSVGRPSVSIKSAGGPFFSSERHQPKSCPHARQALGQFGALVAEISDLTKACQKPRRRAGP